MDTTAILARLDHERRFLQRDSEILESLPNVTRLRSADNLQHTIIHSTLAPDVADAIIVGKSSIIDVSGLVSSGRLSHTIRCRTSYIG